MSAHAEVSARPSSGARAPDALRVRPPSPLSPRRRAAIAIAAAVLLVVCAVLVGQARSADGDEIPGAAWRDSIPVPRAARIDPFDGSGPLGDVAGFGAWQVGTGALQRGEGVLRSTGGQVTATVDAGTSDVLVQARVVRLGSDAGFVLSATGDGTQGLWLVTGKGDAGWQLRWQRGSGAPQVLQSFAAPRADVSVQVIRRGDQVRVAFDDQSYAVDVPPESAAGPFVGVHSSEPGTVLDLFGYLPLDAG